MTNPFVYICPLSYFTVKKKKKTNQWHGGRNQPLETNCGTAQECRRGTCVHVNELRVQGWTEPRASRLTAHPWYWATGLFPGLCSPLPCPGQGADSVCDLWATRQMPSWPWAEHEPGDTILRKILTLQWSHAHLRAAERVRIRALAWESQCNQTRLWGSPGPFFTVVGAWAICLGTQMTSQLLKAGEKCSFLFLPSEWRNSDVIRSVLLQKASRWT